MSATPESELLAPLRERPGAAAVLLDVDGTLAPIAARAEDARVPAPTASLLRELARAYRLVGCVSGRRAAVARQMVGLDELVYLGNHGFERLDPGATEPVMDPAVAAQADAPAEFLSDRDDDLPGLGIRQEDKGPIQALHWRGADDEGAAEDELGDVAAEGEGEGLTTHWGRKVLELRAVDGIDKGSAVARLLADTPGLSAALYAGDDRTDLDAFRALREAVSSGTLEHAVCVGVRSAEGPGEIAAQADLVVEGTEELFRTLSTLVA